MGRKTGTTKGGKAINPADAMRKKMRKKEIQKNKKVRDLVRASVLRSKNPKDIQGDIEILEDQITVLRTQGVVDGRERMLTQRKEKHQESLKKVLDVYKSEKPEKYHDFMDWMRNHEPKRWHGTIQSIQHTAPDNDDSQEDELEVEVDFEDLDAIPMPDGSAPPLSVAAPPPPRPSQPAYGIRPPMFGGAPPIGGGMGSGGGMMRPPMRPPGPPPGAPPRPAMGNPAANGAPESDSTQTAPIFSAQPQIRDFRAEVRQFVPTSLRVKRDTPTAGGMKPRSVTNTSAPRTLPATRTLINPAPQLNPTSTSAAASSTMATAPKAPTTAPPPPPPQDDEYLKFMKEMQGLM